MTSLSLSSGQSADHRRALYSSLSALFVIAIIFLGTLCSGCVERDSKVRFIVSRTTPETPAPGEDLVIYGRGFGPSQESLPLTRDANRISPRQVSIGGRALNISSWSPTLIRASLPIDVPTGERSLVVSRDHIHSPSFPILILGEGGARPAAQPDLSPFERDMHVPQDLTPPPLDQMLGAPLSVTLDNPEATVILNAELREETDRSELWISIISQDSSIPIWGAASHLTYPIDRLEFIRMTEPPSERASAVTGDLEGRVFWYRAELNLEEEISQRTLITLRFKILNLADRSPIRLTIPPRSTSLRDETNQRLSKLWSGGIIALEEVTP